MAACAVRGATPALLKCVPKVFVRRWEPESSLSRNVRARLASEANRSDRFAEDLEVLDSQLCNGHSLRGQILGHQDETCIRLPRPVAREVQAPSHWPALPGRKEIRTTQNPGPAAA